MATLRNPETLLHEITIGYFARQVREKSGTAGHYGVLALEEILSERALELARGLSTPIALQSILISETFSLDDSPICGASVKVDGDGRKVEFQGRRLSADPLGLYEVDGCGMIYFESVSGKLAWRAQRVEPGYFNVGGLTKRMTAEDLVEEIYRYSRIAKGLGNAGFLAVRGLPAEYHALRLFDLAFVTGPFRCVGSGLALTAEHLCLRVPSGSQAWEFVGDLSRNRQLLERLGYDSEEGLARVQKTYLCAPMFPGMPALIIKEAGAPFNYTGELEVEAAFPAKVHSNPMATYMRLGQLDHSGAFAWDSKGDPAINWWLSRGVTIVERAVHAEGLLPSVLLFVRMEDGYWQNVGADRALAPEFLPKAKELVLDIERRGTLRGSYATAAGLLITQIENLLAVPKVNRPKYFRKRANGLMKEAANFARGCRYTESRLQTLRGRLT